MNWKTLFNNMNDKTNSKKRRIRNDVIFILVLLLIAAIGGVYLFLFRPQGNLVKVTVNGESYGVYSLNQNITKDIFTGDNKQQLNRLIIRDGKAYIETASCPDGICVSHRPIFRDGESIVCLPNGVVITVKTTDDTDQLDIVI